MEGISIASIVYERLRLSNGIRKKLVSDKSISKHHANKFVRAEGFKSTSPMNQGRMQDAKSKNNLIQYSNTSVKV